MRSPVHDQRQPRRQHYDSNAHTNHSLLSPPRRLTTHAMPDPDTGTEQAPGEYPDQDAEEDFVEELPQLWSPALDTLMGQTSRAYDLVLAYPRDAEGGLRWYASDIPRIRETGKHLHRDMWALKRCQRTVKYQGDPYLKITRQVERDARRMWDLCKKVQGVIGELEQKNEHELLRTGEFETDEEGNLVKVSKGEREERMRDDMHRRGSWKDGKVAQDGRNNGEVSSPPLFYVDTEPSGTHSHPFSDSHSRARSFSPKSRTRPQYDRRRHWENRPRNHQDYESY